MSWTVYYFLMPIAQNKNYKILSLLLYIYDNKMSANHGTVMYFLWTQKNGVVKPIHQISRKFFKNYSNCL